MKSLSNSPGGWFKMPRRCVDDPLIHKDTDYLAVMTVLLASAVYEPTVDLFGGRCITLQPGQMITGRSKIASISKVHESKVQRILKTFEDAGYIRQQTGNKSRLITLSSWLIGQELEQQTNSKRTAVEQQMNTMKEVKKKESKKSFSSEPKDFASEPVASLPLNDGTLFPIGQEDIQQWQKLYPSVDVMQQLRNMYGWCDSNPSKRKTAKGIRRFITNWLAKEQDHGGRYGHGRNLNNTEDEDEHII